MPGPGTLRDMLVAAAARDAGAPALFELPKGPTGKLVRIGLAGVLGLDRPGRADAAARANSSGAPASEFTGTLRAIWCEVLKLGSVTDDAGFLAVGGDSVSAAQVIARVRVRCRRELAIATFFDRTTFASMAAALAQAVPAASGGSGHAAPVPAA